MDMTGAVANFSVKNVTIAGDGSEGVLRRELKSAPGAKLASDRSPLAYESIKEDEALRQHPQPKQQRLPSVKTSTRPRSFSRISKPIPPVISALALPCPMH